MSTGTAAMNADPEIRPFHVDISDEVVADLRRRIAAGRPPEREPVDDQSQGVQLATVQELANYWATDYDWRRCEAKLNALSQFVTEIDGLDVHFIHVRSPQQNALPLIVSHGWPGSIIEQLKIIEPPISAAAGWSLHLRLAILSLVLGSHRCRHHAERRRWPAILTGTTRMKCSGSPSTHDSRPTLPIDARSASVST